MELRNSFMCRRLRGFTLLEIVLVLSLIAVVAAFALSFPLSAFRSQARQAEMVTLVSLLELSRSDAFANKDRLPHGLAIVGTSYVQFSGVTFDMSNPKTWVTTEMVYPLVLASSSVTEVVFTPLTATTTPTRVQLIDTMSGQSSFIDVNYEGLIQ